MKPRRRVEKVYYWSCAIPKHRHIVKENAARCIDRESWTDERFAKARAMRVAGKSYTEIGRHFHISAARIRVMLPAWLNRQYKQAEEKAEAEAIAKQQAVFDQIAQRRSGHYTFHNPRSGEIILHLFRPGIGPSGLPDIAAMQRGFQPFGTFPSRKVLADTWREMRVEVGKMQCPPANPPK